MRTGNYLFRVALAPVLSALLHVVWRWNPDTAALVQFGLSAFLIPLWLSAVSRRYMVSGGRLRLLAAVVPPVGSFLCVYLFFWNWTATGGQQAPAGATLFLLRIVMLIAGIIAALGTLIAVVSKLRSHRQLAWKEEQRAYSGHH